MIGIETCILISWSIFASPEERVVCNMHDTEQSFFSRGKLFTLRQQFGYLLSETRVV